MVLGKGLQVASAVTCFSQVGGRRDRVTRWLGREPLSQFRREDDGHSKTYVQVRSLPRPLFARHPIDSVVNLKLPDSCAGQNGIMPEKYSRGQTGRLAFTLNVPGGSSGCARIGLVLVSLIPANDVQYVTPKERLAIGW